MLHSVPCVDQRKHEKCWPRTSYSHDTSHRVFFPCTRYYSMYSSSVSVNNPSNRMYVGRCMTHFGALKSRRVVTKLASRMENNAIVIVTTMASITTMASGSPQAHLTKHNFCQEILSVLYEVSSSHVFIRCHTAGDFTKMTTSGLHCSPCPRQKLMVCSS